MKNEITKTVFYHIYPLGLCNCPKQNHFCQRAGDSLKKLTLELPHIKENGFNAIYIGLDLYLKVLLTATTHSIISG